ncbi:MAG: response regulator [Thermodesulfovibrionales bacterium]
MLTQRVLVVDDEKSLRLVLSEFLKDNGCEVLTAASAEKALTIMNNVEFDLAIVDIRLPGMNGIQLLEKIKDRSPDTEVIIITSHVSMDTALDAIQKGAYDYLTKPFDELEEVWFTVIRALEKRHLTISNRHLLEDLSQRNQKLTAAVKRLTSLIEAGCAMGSFQSISDLLSFFIELAVSELGVERSSLMLMDDESKELRIVASIGLAPDIVETVRVEMGEGIAGRVAQSGKPFLLKNNKEKIEMDDQDNPELYAEAFPIALSVPIKHQNNFFGVINVTNRTNDEPFDENDISFLLGLAGQAGVAIESVRNFEELISAYESLKSTQDQLVATERLKALGQMAAGVAHDFNNVLCGIMGKTQLLSTQLLTSEIDPDTMRSELEKIDKVCLQGAEAVKRIQDFTGIRKDRPSDEIDLNKIAENSLDITRSKWKDECEARGIAIEIHRDLDPDITHTAGNEKELTQVLCNMIFNAVEAMPKGGMLTLKTFRHGDNVGVVIADTGKGMNRKTREKIFEPFFTTSESGHGLGLSIVKGIIDRHKGEITVVSKEGSGTTFTITLPVAAVKQAISEPEVYAAEKVPENGRILIIEDEEQNREIFSEALSVVGHEVICVERGMEGIERFEREEFDVVITDLSMPGLSGIEVANSLKKIDPSVPIILLSGWAVHEDETRLKSEGIDYILSKPCPLEKLQEAVGIALSSVKAR